MNDHDLTEEPKPQPTERPDLESLQPPPDILLWRPSLFALLIAGIADGAVLGAANGELAQYIVFDFGSPWIAGLWGAGLGMAGAIVVVLFRRIVWGPDIGVEVGTLLGLIYGIVPGAALSFQAIVVGGIVIASWGFVGFVMAASMGGLLIGGVLDRITDEVIARKKRRSASRMT